MCGHKNGISKCRKPKEEEYHNKKEKKREEKSHILLDVELRGNQNTPNRQFPVLHFEIREHFF